MRSTPDDTLARYLSAHGLRGLTTRIAANRRVLAIAATVVVAVWVLSIALLAIWSRPVEYSAEARVLIVPSQTKGDVPVTSLDTLSRGTVVETFAQVFASPRIRLAAFRRAGLPASTDEDVTIETGVLSGTAIVRIVATARDAGEAEAAADAIAEHRPYLAGYTAAFRPLGLAPAAGTAERAGPSPLVLSVALVAAALINALLVAVLILRRRARAGEQSAAPPVENEPTLTPVEVEAEAEPEPPRISAQG